jgi:hypothetical protein
MLLIDGDIIAYRCAFATSPNDLAARMVLANEYINTIKQNVPHAGPDSYTVYLTGKGNFRDQYAVTQPYKGNRPTERPPFVEDIKQYLLDYHPSDLSQGEEADDRIAIAATQLGDNCTICSIDKDFNQVPGWHYNFVKFKRSYVLEREGLLFFYRQIIMGDRADNILGVHGIGDKKSMKLLQELPTELSMYKLCVELLGSEERVLENAILLWLRREEGQIWTPPNETTPPKEKPIR